MILTGPEIARQVHAGSICIEPFDDAQLNPNSYNYRIGDALIEIADEPIDPRREVTSRFHRLPEEGFLLHPRRLYLAHTAERIGSPEFVTTLIGRSTMGRLGLWLQISADLGHLGEGHRWTLELSVVQPLWIYPNMIVGQVSFWVPQGDLSLQYAGKYAHDITAEPSHIHVEFADGVSDAAADDARDLGEVPEQS